MQPDLAPVINEIRGWHRERCYGMESRKIADLRLGAYLRTQLGWKKDLPKAESEKIKKEVKRLAGLGEKVVKEDVRVEKLIARGKSAKRKDIGLTDAAFSRFSTIIVTTIRCRAPWDDIEARAKTEMERLAAQLPVVPWFQEHVFAKSLVSLAVIVGEAGDLSNYPEKGHLWKRMGLAVIGDGSGKTDIRQGGLGKTASKDEWIAHGYNRKRRSQMFVIGDSLVKGKSEYRKVYLARKQYEKANAKAAGLIVCPAAKIPDKRKDEFVSDGYIHRRAQRYMEKRLLRDLWQAWRRAFALLAEKPMHHMPAAEIERKASFAVPEKAALNLPTAQPKRKRKVISG